MSILIRYASQVLANLFVFLHHVNDYNANGEMFESIRFGPVTSVLFVIFSEFPPLPVFAKHFASYSKCNIIFLQTLNAKIGFTQCLNMSIHGLNEFFLSMCDRMHPINLICLA